MRIWLSSSRFTAYWNIAPNTMSPRRYFRISSEKSLISMRVCQWSKQKKPKNKPHPYLNNPARQNWLIRLTRCKLIFKNLKKTGWLAPSKSSLLSTSGRSSSKLQLFHQSYRPSDSHLSPYNSRTNNLSLLNPCGSMVRNLSSAIDNFKSMSSW